MGGGCVLGDKPARLDEAGMMDQVSGPEPLCWPARRRMRALAHAHMPLARPLSKAAPRPGQAVRRHLLILALTALLPVWMLAGYAAWRDAETQRGAFINDAREAARNLAFVLEREVVGLRGRADGAGQLPALQAGDYPTFHAQAMALQSVDGSQIRLTDTAGRALVDTSVPYGEQLETSAPPSPSALADAPLADGLSGILTSEQPGVAHQVALTLEVRRPGQTALFLSVGTDPCGCGSARCGGRRCRRAGSR
jgi:hypothetical protein